MNGPGSRASQLFLALADIPAGDRQAWLDEHCGDDPDLRREVESLLEGLDAPDEFLDPAALHPHVLDADTPLTPGTRVAEFTIQRVIGSGSAGIVYIAQQRHPQRTVALKILRRGLAASSARRRFEVEAELLGQLHHPGIAQIYGAHPGDETIPPFIAMELVDGPPITDYAREHNLDLRGKVELMVRVCEAVQHAHQRGVIHRDLKPANVLVSRDGEPKVLDFGVARRSGAAVAISTVTTEIGQLVGTVAFMSPEQITAVPSEVDTRSDVYALGVILFRLITGRLPFTEDNPPLPELARRIAMLDPPRLPPAERRLAGDLETVLLTALAKEKERRYPSAADMASDLRRWLADQPIAAAADSAWYLVRRQMIRYRRAAAVAAVAFVALASLAAFALVQRSRAESTAGRLGDELATSNIERARLLGMTGNLRAAEAALWHELFERPDSRHAQWALWELYARQPALWTRVLHPGGASTVVADSAGGRLVTAGKDGRIRIVDPATGEVRQTFTDEALDVAHVAVLPGGPVVTLSGDGALRTWDASGRIARSIEVGTQALGMSVAGPDLVAVTADQRVQIWSVSRGEAVERISLPDVQPTLLDISPDGGTIAFGTETGEVVAWDRERRRVRWRTPLHRGRTSAVRFAPDGLRLASGGGDQLIALLDALTGRVIGRLDPANGTVRALAFDRTGRRLAAAGWWRTLLLEADSTGLREVASFSEPSWRLDLSSDGSLLFTCTEAVAGEVRAWQLDADPRLATWTSHTTRVTGLSATGNLPTIATGATDGSIRIRGLSDATPSVELTNPGALLGLHFDDPGRHLLTAARTGELAAWEIAGSRITQTASAAAGGTAFGASLDGSRLAVGRSDGGLSGWRWNATTFERWFQAPPQMARRWGSRSRVTWSPSRIGTAPPSSTTAARDASFIGS